MHDESIIGISTPAKMLLAASGGGHLAQLFRFRNRLGASDDSLWVTFDTPQARQLLEGRRVLYVPYIQPRDWKSVLVVTKRIRTLLKRESFDAAVSTGAALALAVLPSARLAGIPTHYIESVSRVEGPSISGRALWATRLATMYCQYPSWAGGRWNLVDSILSEFSSHYSDARATEAPKIFVTLGTIKPYRFDRMIDAVLATGLASESTVWQVGVTTRDDLPGTVKDQIGAEEFNRHIHESDVVITHAGVGTILQVVESGKFPVVVPRLRSFQEHVDDHQLQIGALIDNLKIGSTASPTHLTRNMVLRASGMTVAEKRVAS